MSNILIINGAKKFAHSNGQLNDTLTEVADGLLRDLGHDVKIVRAESDYDVKAEVQHFVWADVVIWQMPGWWMGAPWTVKKYMDDVFTEGHGTLYASDGRTRSDASKKYGSGGLIQGKKYMLSLTWNAPMEGFHRQRSVLPRRWRGWRIPAVSQGQSVPRNGSATDLYHQ
ncbi:modulator of drug activity B [Citrobacter koseri]|uniref:Modulator of drug activity B n=1 Tax=Citrobacter koseri TaxID=545 RepID=A0A2X2WB21_CITKO|nr:modulator of drug activity B [Citrobacter koseri]